MIAKRFSAFFRRATYRGSLSHCGQRSLCTALFRFPLSSMFHHQVLSKPFRISTRRHGYALMVRVRGTPLRGSGIHQIDSARVGRVFVIEQPSSPPVLVLQRIGCWKQRSRIVHEYLREATLPFDGSVGHEGLRRPVLAGCCADDGRNQEASLKRFHGNFPRWMIGGGAAI